MSGWARDHVDCVRCHRKVYPHKGRGLCSSCYGRLYRRAELKGTIYANTVEWERDYMENEWKQEAIAEAAWEEEVTAAWILWHESPSLDPIGWGL